MLELNDDVLKFYPEVAGIHPVANIWPMANENDFAELVDRISKSGLANAIVLQKGTNLLVDGRNRLLACYQLGREVFFEYTEIDPLEFALDSNARRNLTAPQKAFVADNLRGYFDEQAKARQRAGGVAGGKVSPKQKDKVREKLPEPVEQERPRDAAGKLVGVSGKYVDMATAVREYVPELKDEIVAGKVSLADGYAAAKKVKKFEKEEGRKASKHEIAGVVKATVKKKTSVDAEVVYSEGANDECYTPVYGVLPILPHMERFRGKTIWCPFDKADSNFVLELRNAGHTVVHSHIDDGQDFYTYEPEHWDVIVSNPPFTNKRKIFERALAFGKPFAMIMSNTWLNDAAPKDIFEERGLQLLMFKERMKFLNADNGDNKITFSSSYFCCDFLTGRDNQVASLKDYGYV